MKSLSFFHVTLLLCLFFISSVYAAKKDSAYDLKMDWGFGLGLGYLGLITDDSKSNDLEDYNGEIVIQLSIYGNCFVKENMALYFGLAKYVTNYSGLADKMKNYKEEVSFQFEYSIFSFLLRYYPTSFFYLEIGPQLKIYDEDLSHIYYTHESEDPLIHRDVPIKNAYAGVIDLKYGIGIRIKRIEISLTSMIDITPFAKASSFKSDYSNASVRSYSLILNFSFDFLRRS